MAVTASGLFYPTWAAVLNATQLALALIGDDVKFAMYTNSLTPNFSTDTQYNAAPYTSNEVSGTGYTTGGVSLASKTITESPTGTLMYDCADPSWASSTITGARAGLTYDNTLTNKNVIGLTNFGADFSTQNGTFTVQLPSTGLLFIDLTP
jgi:hypothetical protein